MALKVAYCIITRTGVLKKKAGRATLYEHTSSAQRGAKNDGDAVVAIDIDLDREPIFIRKKVLDGS